MWDPDVRASLECYSFLENVGPPAEVLYGEIWT